MSDTKKFYKAAGFLWTSTHKQVFTEVDDENSKTIFYKAIPHVDDSATGIVLVSVNNSSKILDIKDILIGLGIYRLGSVGLTKNTPRKIRVKCPSCQKIQRLQSELQKCENCGKKFYLFAK
tara:strand:- start:2 stop:364 length:363 start_codon:yes stop_codon:yes gene_type:complete